MATVEVGQVLAGKLQVEGILGRGGMGLVLVAKHTILNERVAVKLMRPESASVTSGHDLVQTERFFREARAAARLKGPHITRVMDVGSLEDGAPYIVMEYIEGVTLSGILKEHGPLSIEEAIDFITQACEGLAEAHAIDIVHRDLKPSNLMVTRGVDGSPLLKILDFGIARYGGGEHATLTGSSVMLGSPSYMSPEQIRDAHEVDARSDIWSLGVTLFELLTGHLPFEAFTPAGLIARISVDPPAPVEDFRADVPPTLRAVVSRCLEKDPADRFSNVADLVDAMLPFAPPRSTQVVTRIHRVFQEKQSAPLVGRSGPAGKHGAITPVAARSNPSGARSATPRNAPIALAETQQAQTFSQEPHTLSTTNPDAKAPSSEVAPAPSRKGWWLAALALFAMPVGGFFLRPSQKVPHPVEPATAALSSGKTTPSAEPAASAAAPPSADPTAPAPALSAGALPLNPAGSFSTGRTGFPKGGVPVVGGPLPRAGAAGAPASPPGTTTSFSSDFGGRKLAANASPPNPLPIFVGRGSQRG